MPEDPVKEVHENREESERERKRKLAVLTPVAKKCQRIFNENYIATIRTSPIVHATLDTTEAVDNGFLAIAAFVIENFQPRNKSDTE
jgi:uncharacterized protein YnzC (UPF0291/DUF896 family)